MYKRILFIIEAMILFVILPFLSFATCVYWIPYKDTTHFGPNGTSNILYVFSKDLANISIDGNDTLLQGNYTHILKGDKFQEGSKIISDVPLQIWYRYSIADYGAYDEGAISYEILPQGLLGNSYWLPLSTTELVILAITNGTTVQVGSNNYNLNEGKAEHILSPSAGVHITSNNPISVVAVNYDNNCYDNTYSFPLYPENLLDTVYFIPHQHSYNYNSSTESSKVWVVATQNNTTVNFGSSQNLNQGDVASFPNTSGGKLAADKSVAIVWLSDIYAQDPWTSDYRHYTYAIVPISKKVAGKGAYIMTRKGTSHGYPLVEVFLVSLEDNNTVNFDVGGDGSIEGTELLNRGDTLYYHEEDFPGWDTLPLLIEGSEKLQVTFSRSGWWGNISESRNAETLIGLTYSPSGVENKPGRRHAYPKIEIFPNPFNKFTVISYQLPDKPTTKNQQLTIVSLTIHDISGRIIRKFPINDSRFTTNEIRWDGTDDNGKKVASGIYFYRMEVPINRDFAGSTGEFKATRKLTILK